MKSKLLILIVLLSAIGLAAPPQATKKPLTKDQVMELVQGSVPSARVAQIVRQRDIDFDPSEDYLRALQSAGAEEVLIDALRSAAAAKVAARDAVAKQHINGANALMDTGDIEGAIGLYRKAIQGSPGDAEAHRLLGIALGKKKDWQGDIAEQREAMLLKPDDTAVKAELEVALRSAEAERARADASRTASVVKAPPQDPVAKQHINGANALMGTGDIDGAIGLYQKAIQVSPGDAEAHRLLGIALGKKKDWQGDITEQRVAILLKPDDAAAKAELNVAFRGAEAERVRKDDSLATSAVKSPAQDAAAQAKQAFASGQLQLGQRKFEAAAMSFSEAARLKPDWPEPLVERAKTYMKLYLFQEAIHSYDKAIGLKPNDPAILNLRGYAYYSASEFKRAITDFDEAIRLAPDMAEAYKNRGNAEWQMGDKIGANADFEKARVLESNTHAQKNATRR
jgi:Flp pilus assembly protein TadD